MDYFGRVLDDLTDLWEEISASPHADDAGSVLKALEKAMQAAAEVERSRARRAPPGKGAPARRSKIGSRRAA